eukprot:TRINITY_DN14008_c0_g1_i1.p1 TRINITY_DN14008_c0_g1~~TRINITY_DN14008_c0_g1_i1.p1  ORF type:complete len:219 (-),score=34.17 TRINITY_DN14008_c0_g1_i1:23-658(-)
MLAADKRALESLLTKQALDIAERELQFFVRAIGAVASQGSLLAGFAFSGIVGSQDLDDENALARTTFYVTAVIAMALQMYVLSQATILMVCGRSLALRGPAGSMQKAVEGMREERKQLFLCFGMGLVFLQFSVIARTWGSLTNNVIAMIVTVIIVLFLVLLSWNMRRVYQRFRIGKSLRVAHAAPITAEEANVRIPTSMASPVSPSIGSIQ